MLGVNDHRAFMLCDSMICSCLRLKKIEIWKLETIIFTEKRHSRHNLCSFEIQNATIYSVLPNPC